MDSYFIEGEMSRSKGGRIPVSRIINVVMFLLVAAGVCFAQWQSPANVTSVNSTWDEVRSAISSDGNRLYISSDRPGGQGEHDIWESVKNGGVWQTPTNLDPPVNTMYMDWLPAISSTGDFIYFISDRPGGLGDFDIWESRNVGGVWQTPVNHTILNTPGTE